MQTKLISVLTSDDGAVFERTDGKEVYRIKASWDKTLNSWFQSGAPKEVLAENVKDVQKYYWNKRSVDFKRMLNA